MSSSEDWALEAEGLSKAYRIYRGPGPRILEAISRGKYKGHHEFWALQNVSLKLRRGASLGLCGANGAGKSTLMKILAGTTSPTQGRYRFSGRMASLLELGAGFHAEFTGRANIVMNGVMMGIPRREIEAKMEAIIDFAELGDYIDEPVRTYSSGMGLRLGFSVAMAILPEILIIDEVFAVGDMYFQKKCIDKIYELRKTGTTIVFCSHSLYDVRQLCDEALWLDHGLVKAQGDSVFVTNEYTAFQRDHIGDADELMAEQFPLAPALEGKAQDKVVRGIPDFPRIRDARIYRAGTDEEAYEITTGDSIEFRIWWENPSPEKMPIEVGVGFLRQDMTTCGGCSTGFDKFSVKGKEGCLVLKVPSVKLLSGQFMVPIWLLDENGVHRYHEYLVPENLVVRTNTRAVGLFSIDHEWETSEHALPKSKKKALAEAASEASSESADVSVGEAS
ncbi:MAG: lipopolysaccharide transport system ATP-binding protein [Planctomycetota bacterium]|jgi:lipopolysaccharide transport system ATP-binding protein